MLSKLEGLEVENIVALLQQADDFLLLLDAAIAAVGKVGERVKPVMEAVGDWQVERRIREYQRYRDAGMSSAEAVSLLCALANERAAVIGAALGGVQS